MPEERKPGQLQVKSCALMPGIAVDHALKQGFSRLLIAGTQLPQTIQVETVHRTIERMVVVPDKHIWY